MRKLLLSILGFSQLVWASDPVRPATTAEIESMDAKITLSMGLENAKIDGKKAGDKFYSDFFDMGDGQDYLKCIDRKPLKFSDSKLKARFSVSRTKGQKPMKVEISFLPVQKDKGSSDCLKELVKAVDKIMDPSAATASGELVYKYSRPLKYDQMQ